MEGLLGLQQPPCSRSDRLPRAAGGKRAAACNPAALCGGGLRAQLGGACCCARHRTCAPCQTCWATWHSRVSSADSLTLQYAQACPPTPLPRSCTTLLVLVGAAPDTMQLALASTSGLVAKPCVARPSRRTNVVVRAAAVATKLNTKRSEEVRRGRAPPPHTLETRSRAPNRAAQRMRMGSGPGARRVLRRRPWCAAAPRAAAPPSSCHRSSRRRRSCCPVASTPPCAPSRAWAASPSCLTASRAPTAGTPTTTSTSTTVRLQACLRLVFDGRLHIGGGCCALGALHGQDAASAQGLQRC